MTFTELYQEYEQVSRQLASIYKIGESNPEIVRLSIRKSELENTLAEIAEQVQDIPFNHIGYLELWEEEQAVPFDPQAETYRHGWNNYLWDAMENPYHKREEQAS